MKKLVIFDLDGTLLNSIYAISNSVNKTLEFFKLKTYSEEEYYSFVGNGLLELIRKIIKKEKYNIDENLLYKKLIEIYNKEFDYNLDIYNGIDKLLDYFISKNVKIAIITNKDEVLAKKSVNSTILKKYNFVEIIGLNENLEEKKPNPININRLKEKFNLKNENILFVGDMLVDYNSAKNANVDFVYCNWGFGKLINEIGIDDKYKVDNINQIIERYIYEN